MPIGSLAQQTASNTGQPIGIEDNHKTLRVWFTFKLTGNYPLHGDPLDLTLLFATTAGGPGASLPTGSLPIKVEFQSVLSGGQTAAYIYQYSPGTTLANGTVQLFTGAAAQSGLTEFTAGAYPAGVLADTIQGEAIFPKL